jgi:thiol:disulfide interchange protein
MLNQLPKALKLRIHKVISGQLSSRSLVIGAIVMGFLVTLLEAVCTGQVYLPTIVLMTRQEGLRLTGWLYLIFYNFLFVLPLLIVMVLAYFGMTWNTLAKTTQKHMTLLKVLLGLMLLGLAVFLGISA